MSLLRWLVCLHPYYRKVYRHADNYGMSDKRFVRWAMKGWL